MDLTSTPDPTNDLLSPPTTVVGVGGALSDEDRRAIRAGVAERVRTVDTGDQALALVRKRIVGCVVTPDATMDGSGIGLCRRIREVDRALPVIVLLSNPSGERLENAIEADVTDVLSPTAPASDLRAVVDPALGDYLERRRADAQSEMLDAMLASLGVPIYFKDEQGRHVRIADVPGGFDPETARGKTDPELYGDDDPGAARDAHADDMHVIETREPVRERIERVGQDGSLWMRTTKVPWIEDGEVQGLIGHTVNVTDLKNKELKLEELSRRFESFTTRLRHDVRNPLQVATGRLQLALESDETQPIEDALSALEQVEDIVDDYDALAKQTSDVEEVLVPTALRSLVEEIRNSLDTTAATIAIDVGEDVRINATEAMVRPVLENLLTNALVHGGDDVSVTVGLTDTGFYVADDGPGIPESDRERVLERGFTTAPEGTGQGLNIVASEVDKHVWSLDVQESDSGGARVEINDCLVDTSGRATAAETTDVALDQRTEVGDLEWGGLAEYDDSTDRWYLASDGDDVYRQDNDFFFVHATVAGDVSIQANVVDVDHVDEYSKGGIMVRDDVDEAASYAYVGQTPAFGTELLWRETWGADGRSEQLSERAFTFSWYRIDRSGEDVSLSLSMDGQHWQQIATRTVELSDPIEVGLVGCSCVVGRRGEATFESVEGRTFPEDD